MKLTDEQRKAVYETGKNIIVSAGAGSGKTAVLTKRISEKVKSGISVSNLLVLTFTNAAAREMKERVRKVLSEEGGFERELTKLDSSYITTFDAFSLAMVKKYNYKLGVSKSLRIASSLVIKELIKNVIDDYFSALYEIGDPEFLNFITIYTEKDDNKLRDTLVDLYYKISLLPDTNKYLDEYEANFFETDNIKKFVLEYEKVILAKKEDVLCEIYDFKKIVAQDDSNEKILISLDELSSDLNYVNSYEDLKVLMDSFKLPSLAKGTDEYIKKAKEDFSKQIKEFKDNLGVYNNKQEMLNKMLEMKDSAIFFSKTLRVISSKVMEYKKQHNYFEFIDIAKMSISLVRDYEDVRNELRDNYKEILIDEYQDTSDLQEEFISYLEHDNLYMVGDMKQAIYRFRNANPYIFKNKFDKFHSDSNLGIGIELNRNFRSRSEVVNNINRLFSSIMTDEFGDASYAKEHKMVFGQTSYDTTGHVSDSCDMRILKYAKQDDFTKEEVEAFIIANDIKNKLKSAKVMDKKTLNTRDATYSDFCILIDKSASFDTFKKIFDYAHIPLSIIGSLDLKESDLSKVLINLMIIIGHINEKKFDKTFFHALTSVARSFIYNYNDTQILDIVRATPFNNEIFNTCKKLSASIDIISPKDLFYQALNEVNLYEKLPIYGDTMASLVQIENIANMIDELAYIGKKFDDIFLFLYDALSSDSKLDYNIDEGNGNQVKIMTIHKSKGLEFPFCYFPLLSSGFNKSEQKASIGFHPDYGFYLPVCNDGYIPTILKELIANRLSNEDISEKIRLFYVGLTRAREQIIMITDSDEVKQKFMNPINTNCFKHLLLQAGGLSSYSESVNLDDINLSKDYLGGGKKAILDIKNKMPIYQERNYVGNEIKKKHISKEMTKLIDKSLANNINLGLEFHEALQVLDFNNINVDELNTAPFIKEQIKKMLTHPIFENISEAKTYHEHEFYFTKDENDYHGIIDLLAIYDDHIDIVDYKLKQVLCEEYKHQLSVYKQYVETKTNLVVNTYLFSILDEAITKIDV